MKPPMLIQSNYMCSYVNATIVVW